MKLVQNLVLFSVISCSYGTKVPQVTSNSGPTLINTVTEFSQCSGGQKVVDYSLGIRNNGEKVTRTKDDENIFFQTDFNNKKSKAISLGFNGSITIELDAPLIPGQEFSVYEKTLFTQSCEEFPERAEVYAVKTNGEEVLLKDNYGKNSICHTGKFKISNNLKNIKRIKVKDISSRTHFNELADGFDLSGIKCHQVDYKFAMKALGKRLPASGESERNTLLCDKAISVVDLNKYNHIHGSKNCEIHTALIPKGKLFFSGKLTVYGQLVAKDNVEFDPNSKVEIYGYSDIHNDFIVQESANVKVHNMYKFRQPAQVNGQLEIFNYQDNKNVNDKSFFQGNDSGKIIIND